MKAVVAKLLTMVGGLKKAKRQTRDKSIKSLVQKARSVIPAANTDAAVNQVSKHQAGEVKPVQAIDMNEDEFNDF